ncbi:MAG: hypothetical protein ACK5AN_04350, partial [Planctomyces sp.]
AGWPAIELPQPLLSWIFVPASLVPGRCPYRQPKCRKIRLRPHKIHRDIPGKHWNLSAEQIIGSQTGQTLRLGVRSVNIRYSRITHQFLNFRNLPVTD